MADIEVDELGIQKAIPKAKNSKQETLERINEFNILNKFNARLNAINISRGIKKYLIT